MLGIDHVKFRGRLWKDRTPFEGGLEVLRRIERAIVRPRSPDAKEEREVGDDSWE